MERSHRIRHILARARKEPGRAAVLAGLGACFLGLLVHSQAIPSESLSSVASAGPSGYVLAGRNGNAAGIIWAGNAGNGGNTGNTGGETPDPDPDPDEPEVGTPGWIGGHPGAYGDTNSDEPAADLTGKKPVCQRGKPVNGGRIVNFFCGLLTSS